MCTSLSYLFQRECDARYAHMGPVINRLNYFRIWFRFRRDIKMFKKLRCERPTLVTDSMLCIVHHTTDEDNEESKILLVSGCS